MNQFNIARLDGNMVQLLSNEEMANMYYHLHKKAGQKCI